MRIFVLIPLLLVLLMPTSGCVWLGEKLIFSKPVNPYTNAERRRPCGNPMPGQEVNRDNPNCRAGWQY